MSPWEMMESARRIYTPDDTGSCMVCGRPEGEHSRSSGWDGDPALCMPDPAHVRIPRHLDPTLCDHGLVAASCHHCRRDASTGCPICAAPLGEPCSTRSRREIVRMGRHHADFSRVPHEERADLVAPPAEVTALTVTDEQPVHVYAELRLDDQWWRIAQYGGLSGDHILESITTISRERGQCWAYAVSVGPGFAECLPEIVADYIARNAAVRK